MLWYVPSWNGDIRFESCGEHETIVTVIKPTAAELAQVTAIERVFFAQGWLEGGLWNTERNDPVQATIVKAPLLDVGQRILASYAPGKAVLTGIRFENGEVNVIEAGQGFWRRIAEALHLPDALSIAASEREVKPSEEIAVASTETSPHRQEAPPPAEPEKPEKKKPKAEAAATVKKPTSCCPTCFEAPIEPAREVLFAFLSADEIAQWYEDHAIVVTGGYTGHEYLLSHRNGRWAAKHGKICHDLDDDTTLHFHDTTVPPEEEVLAAKLILEHREDWLRNESTLFMSAYDPFDPRARPGMRRGLPQRFKNPFGDGSDGTRSAAFTHGFGDGLIRALQGAR